MVERQSARHSAWSIQLVEARLRAIHPPLSRRWVNRGRPSRARRIGGLGLERAAAALQKMQLGACPAVGVFAPHLRQRPGIRAGRLHTMWGTARRLGPRLRPGAPVLGFNGRRWSAAEMVLQLFII